MLFGITTPPYLGDIAFFGSCTLRSKANAKQRVSGISSIDVKVDEAISLRLKSIDHLKVYHVIDAVKQNVLRLDIKMDEI